MDSFADKLTMAFVKLTISLIINMAGTDMERKTQKQQKPGSVKSKEHKSMKRNSHACQNCFFTNNSSAFTQHVGVSGSSWSDAAGQHRFWLL